MYQSTHTGAQIDEAVDKALGYGLGGNGKYLSASVNINDIVESGFYYWGTAPTNAPFGYGNMVVAASPARVMQMIVSTQNGGVSIRTLYNGVWSNNSIGSNRNLLDNGWFTINQREVADATTITGNGYVADRWQAIGNGAQRVAGGGITVLGTAYHKLGDLGIAGKTVTLSILYSDGEISSNTFVWAGTQFSKTFKYGTVTIYPSANQINVGAQSVNVTAIKLELGSVSTLANDAPPSFAEELAKCQRYYYRIEANAYDIIAMGIISDSNNLASFLINFPVPMARAPTPSYSGTFGINSTQFGDATHHHTSTTPFRANAYFTVSYTAPQGTAATLQDRGNGNAVLEFSADLQ